MGANGVLMPGSVHSKKSVRFGRTGIGLALSRLYLRRGKILIVLVLVGMSVTNSGQQSLSSNRIDEIREILRSRIEQADYPPHITVGEEIIHASVDLQRFYEDRLFQPAWVRADGHLPAAEALLQTIRDAVREGLRPDDYHLAMAEALLGRLRANDRPQRASLLAVVVQRVWECRRGVFSPRREAVKRVQHAIGRSRSQVNALGMPSN